MQKKKEMTVQCIFHGASARMCFLSWTSGQRWNAALCFWPDCRGRRSARTVIYGGVLWRFTDGISSGLDGGQCWVSLLLRPSVAVLVPIPASAALGQCLLSKRKVWQEPLAICFCEPSLLGGSTLRKLGAPDGDQSQHGSSRAQPGAGDGARCLHCFRPGLE